MICGSSQGIGKAIAIELASLGASCLLLARNEERLREVVKELPRQEHQEHFFFVADFQDLSSLERVLSTITATHAVDILINNTGGPAAGPIATASPFEFENAFRQHLVCNHLIAQALVPGMKEKGWGRIINIISTSVRIPLDNLGVSQTLRACPL